MMKWIPAVLVLLLSACSSTPEKIYYQLPALSTPTPTPTQVNVSTSSRHLWLEQFKVADFLSQSGIVYQTNDVQYVIAQNNLWASPLDQQLQQALLTNLSSALPGWVVSSQPMSSDQDTLSVTINGFHGRHDGKAIVQGEWMLNHQGNFTKRSFNLELPQGEDGYDTLIHTLAKGWQQEAGVIAAQVLRQ